jgi:hypothetical protein
MKNMAVIEGNTVVNIILCNEDEPETNNLIIYSDSNPAYIGGDYVDGYFYAPQPYVSWTRNKGVWEAPVAYPDDGEFYNWNEEDLNWDLIENRV